MHEFTLKDNIVTLKIKISQKEWEDRLQEAYESNKSRFSITGFRKGHAPRKVIEKTYGDDVFYEDAVQSIANAEMIEFITKNPKLEPLQAPNITNVVMDNEGLKFDLSFEIMPEIKLCKYTDLEFKKLSTKVTEEDINHEIEHLLNDNATFKDVERETKNGDQVVIDFVGYVDEKEFEGGRAENFPLELGSHTFIEGFEEQLVGKKKGDDVKVNIKFPDNYVEYLAGKSGYFNVKIKEVREKTLPTLDDKFISNATEYENLEEYKKHLQEHIQSMKEDRSIARLKSDIYEYLLKNTNVVAPKFMVDNEVHAEMHEIEDRAKSFGMTMEQYFDAVKMPIEEYREMCKQRADRSIRMHFIFEQFFDELKITAYEEEIKAQIDKMKLNREDENARLQAIHMVKVNKVFDYLCKNNKLVEVDTVEEL